MEYIFFTKIKIRKYTQKFILKLYSILKITILLKNLIGYGPKSWNSKSRQAKIPKLKIPKSKIPTGSKSRQGQNPDKSKSRQGQNPDRPKSRQILDFVIHRPVDALLHVKSRDHVIYKIYLNICIEKMSQLYFFLTVIFIF